MKCIVKKNKFLVSYQYLLLFPTTVSQKTRKRAKTELFLGLGTLTFLSACEDLSFLLR